MGTSTATMAGANDAYFAAGPAAGNNLSFGGTPPTNSGAQPQQPNDKKDPSQHQRTYQACIPCRKRKVRCDMGSVDNPHDPPCLRCRREAKDCYFSSTRRKKKGPDGSGTLSEEPDGDGYELKTGRKRLRTSTMDGEDDERYDEPPRTPGGSIGRNQPLRRPEGPKRVVYGEEDIKASEQTTAMLQNHEVHSGHDALKLLYEAAVQGRGRTGSSTSIGRPSLSGPSPSSLPPVMSPMERNPLQRPLNGAPPSRSINVGVSQPQLQSKPDDYNTALRAWSRFRFVRQGWFTAKEGMAYIDYFYKYLAPLTPAALPDFRAPETHARLLTQEPVLSVTILLVASRHMELEGPGSQSRPYVIHQKLWDYLQGMIDRLVWGQEQFGGGFCGAGAEPGCDVNPLSRRGLRTLGTAESLILLTEWHPRAMHFPPSVSDDDLMLPEETIAPDFDAEDAASKGIGGQRLDSWLEPCWRSDRMCWMLLGIAMSLSFEIGVFDKSEWQRHAISATGQPLVNEELRQYDKRRGNVRDLLLVYVTLTSGRLGLTSMLPNEYSKPEDSDLWRRQLGQHESVQETVMHFWLRISAILREGNQKIFANKAFTRDLIKNGNYIEVLDAVQQPFIDWRRDFDKCISIPKYMRHILMIEYEYCRVYLNALALQAVAERCANDHPAIVPIVGQPQDHARSFVTPNGVKTEVAIQPQTLSKWLGNDRKYMIEVRDAACHLLRVVVDGLCPGNYLKHAPVRTYFRIISVAIMLLKSFSLGASEADVADSLKLMDRTVEALRTCIVDDVHVASRFADLLATLTENLKPRLVRISADGRVTGRSRRESQHSTPAHPPQQMQHNGGMFSHQQHQAAPGAVLDQQQWPYATPEPQHANPLFGISNDTYDLMGNADNFSIMPPPSFGLQSPNQNTAPGGTGAINAPSNGGFGNNHFASPTNEFGGPDDGMQDWLALPLDPLLNISGADVNQTMYGPELGGQDMLELLLNGNGGMGGGHGQGFQ